MRFPTVRLEKYVIMPNHIHLLLMLRDETAGASPHPTLMQIMGVFKSLTTRKQNMKTGRQGEKLWQTSYHEHIVRDENDFLFQWTYIDQNPARWGGDEYFGGTPERERKREEEKQLAAHCGRHRPDHCTDYRGQDDLRHAGAGRPPGAAEP